MGPYRTIDGSNNNAANPEWGQAETQLVRVSNADYGDGISTLAGGARPSAREVSNAVFSQSETTGNVLGISDYLWMWGQFIDHDLSITENATVKEPAPILVPTGDPHFDPAGTGTATIDFNRSAHEEGSTWGGASGPRQQVNQITAFIDASSVYGSDELRAETLRDDTGKLNVSAGNLPMLNRAQLPNAPTTDPSLFLAGDVRANENIGLTSLHTIFMREHNRLVDEMSVKNPYWDGDKLYQEARKVVEAQLQIITYNEFLPHLVGEHAMDDWSGYKADVNPQVANEFSTAAFRLGHSLLSSEIMRTREDGSESEFGHLALRDAFFRPDRLVNEGGVDDILRGAAVGQSEELDAKIVDDVRNFLFGPPGSGGLDLASLNIQRGRDHGLDDYNDVREAYGLERVWEFSDITSDPQLQARLEELYQTVDNIDLYAGGLAEDPVDGSLLGELFQTIVVDQFARVRDGDSYWHENRMSDDELASVADVKLSDIILRNTDIDVIQDDVFLSHTRVGGTDGDDVLSATDGRSLVTGGKGHDTLYGGDGDTELHGGAGNDMIMAGYGNTRIDGGAGDDHIEAGYGRDVISFSAGHDEVVGFNSAEDILAFSSAIGIQSVKDIHVQSIDGGSLVSDEMGNSMWLDGVHDLSPDMMTFEGGTGHSAPSGPYPEPPMPDYPNPDYPMPDDPAPDYPMPDDPKPEDPKPDDPKPGDPMFDCPVPEDPKDNWCEPDEVVWDCPEPEYEMPFCPVEEDPKGGWCEPDYAMTDYMEPEYDMPFCPVPEDPKDNWCEPEYPVWDCEVPEPVVCDWGADDYWQPDWSMQDTVVPTSGGMVPSGDIDNLIHNSAGTDYFVGGDGIDVVRVSGHSSDYTIASTLDDDGYVMWNDIEHDLLYDVEWVEFDDVAVETSDYA